MTTITEATARYSQVLQVTHAATSKKTYLSRLKFLREQLDNMSIEEIKLEHLERSLAAYRKTRSPNTTALCVTVWREFFTWCEDVELRTGNPAARLRSPRRTKWKPRAMSEPALQELLKKLQSTVDAGEWQSVRNMAMIRCFVFTGLRRAELANLEWQMIDLPGATMTVTGKGSKKRTIPLNRTMVDLLKKLQKAGGRNYGHVFCKDDGTAMHPYTLNMIFRRWIQQELATYVTPHMLRHTFATMLIDRGAALDEIRDLLGHESIATTQIYINTSLERLRKAVNKLDML